jgi:uncharacterized protein YaaQ
MDAYYNDVTLLIPFDKHCKGKIADYSLLNQTINKIGDVFISDTVADFANGYEGVGVFDGSGDYLTLDNTGQLIGTTDFTIEAIVKTTTSASDQTIFFIGDFNNSNSDYLNALLEINTGKLRGVIRNGSGTTNLDISTTTSITANVYQHYAFTVSSTTARLFINGVKEAEGAVSGNRANGISTAVIGALFSAVTRYFNGNMAWLRITKGVARYTADFTQLTIDDLGVSKIDLSVIESLAADKFSLLATEMETGLWAGSKTISTTNGTNSASLSVYTKKPISITVSPYNGKLWKPSTVYAVNDLVFPSDANTTPYYYKRINAGTSGTTEPTWNTAQAGQCNDGAVTNAWERVAGLVHPMTKSFIVPQ